MAQYAIKGYSVGALDFVMKPVSYYTFQMKFTRALERAAKRRNEEILLTLPDRIQRIGVQQIHYVEVQDHMLHYHTEQGEYVLRGTLQNARKTAGALPLCALQPLVHRQPGACAAGQARYRGGGRP